MMITDFITGKNALKLINDGLFKKYIVFNDFICWYMDISDKQSSNKDYFSILYTLGFILFLFILDLY